METITIEPRGIMTDEEVVKVSTTKETVNVEEYSKSQVEGKIVFLEAELIKFKDLLSRFNPQIIK